MDFIRSASGKSIWRGYYYYDENRATVTRRVSETIIQGTVSGSSSNLYSVEIDLAHPKRSKCDCPFADGKQIICKHKVALYFTAFPEDAEQFYDDALEYEEEQKKQQLEEELRQNELADLLVRKINSMKKDELRHALLELLFDGPEWQYESFLDRYL